MSETKKTTPVIVTVLLTGVGALLAFASARKAEPDGPAASVSVSAPPAPVDADAFAQEVLAAAKAAHPEADVKYVASRFVLAWSTDGGTQGELALARMHKEYAALSPEERAGFVKLRVARLAGAELPATWTEAEANVVPIVRERISYEIARIFVSDAPLTSPAREFPHRALTDAVWAGVAYDAGDQFVRVDGTRLAAWGKTFADVEAKALARLEAQSKTPRVERLGKGDRLTRLRFDDGNASARLLLPGVLALARGGDAARALAVATPRDDELLVAPADDDAALQALADELVRQWKDGATNLRVLRVAGGTFAPFEVPPASAAFAAIDDLRRSAEQREEKAQREALRQKLGTVGEVPFVASLMRAKNPATTDELAAAIHTEGVLTLLPRAEWVVFQTVDEGKNTITLLGCARFDETRALMKDRWKEQSALWPPRWLARDLPTKAELAKLGCEHPMLKKDLGVARQGRPR